jgi:putative ABC transport system permease protein
MRLSLRTASRIAWRETRSSYTKFTFVVFAVAIGVGALAGVRGFSESVRAMLNSESRTIMAADLSARQFASPKQDQITQLDQLSKRGVDRTLITETVSMAAATTPDATPALVSIKAVDPARYPYYGTVKLSPEMPLSQALTPGTVIAGEDVLIRLGVKVGDPVRLGSADFRMAAMVLSEPDRMSGSLNVGLRMMISREGFERTGLMQLGSRAAERYLFKIQPNGPSMEDARAAILDALPEARVIDSSESNPLITRGLDQATTFLSLISLIALIVGAIGVGVAMYAHLQQKMDNIAVMKSLGGTSAEIIRIYVIQTLMLGLLGGIAGVLLGRAVEQVFPSLINKIFEIKAAPGWHFDAAIQGISVGLLTTLLFTLPPLVAIRKIRPAIILRRGMADTKLSFRSRIGSAREAVVLGGIILLGLGGIAAWLAGSARVGGYFAGGLVFSLLALTAVAAVLLRLLRLVVRRSPVRLPSLVRQGFANLYRPGNQAQSILVAMGLGVMFTLSVYLIQHSLIDEIIQTAPPGVPNVYLVGVTLEQSAPLTKLISAQNGILTAPQLFPSVAARLVRVDGQDIASRPVQGFSRRFSNTRSVTWENQLPDNLVVRQGAWWKPDTTEPVVSVAMDAAQALDIHPGSHLEWEVAGRPLNVRVTAVHDIEAMRAAAPVEFVFNPQSLAGLPVVFNGGVRIQPSQAGALQRAIFDKYPTVTVVNVADVLQTVQQIIDQIALVIRFLSAFAILAGAIILAASVAGTRFRRIREVVILKTLGGTRQHIARIFSIEFLTIGAVAGLLGGLLASAFSRILLTRLLDAKFELDVRAILVCVALTALLANAAGWFASVRILGQKPLEVLREE